MAASKFSILCVALILASNYSPAYAQAQRTPQDFWVTFAELLTANVLNWFVNLDIIPNELFGNQPATVAPPASREFRIQFVNGAPVIVPISGPIQPAPTPAPTPAPSKNDPLADFFKTIIALYGGNTNQPSKPVPYPWPVVPATTQAPPCTTTPKCPGGECKPEQVRIVLVNDCKEHKDSSESCSHESSEEVDVILPRGRYGRRSK